MKLHTLYDYFRTHPEGSWILIWDNAQELYNYIIETPGIKKVMDLGCGIGCSASIAALALQDKGEKNYHIDTLEQYDKCIKIAEKIIPEDFKKNITIHKSEVKIWKTDLLPYQYFSNYTKIPSWDYDLIIQDGPAPWKSDNGKNYIELDNGTITEALIKGDLKAGTRIAWDGRVRALHFLERYFSENFYLTRPPHIPNGDFNVIQRKDNEFKFRDDRLVTMEEAGYFKEPTTTDGKKPQSKSKPQEPSDPPSPSPQ